MAARDERLDQRAGEEADVRRGEVQPLCASRRDDMPRVTGKEQAAEAKRLGDEASQRRDALFDGRADDHRLGSLAVEAATQLVPKGGIAPLLGVIVERALDVVTSTRRRAHGAQRKAALVVRVDQLVRYRRRVGEDAEPAERVDALVGGDAIFRNARAAHAVVAVAPGDEVALQPMLAAVLAPRHARRGGVEIVRSNLVRFVDRRAAEIAARIHEVVRDFGLAVDDDPLAARQAMQVDAMAGVAERQLDAVVEKPFATHARAYAGLVEQVGRRLLEHAGSDAAQYVLAAASFQDDVVNAGAMQQLTEQQSRRPGADDRDLRSRGRHTAILPPASPGPQIAPTTARRACARRARCAAA